MAHRFENERGEGRVGLLLSLAVLLSACYVAYVLIPIKVRTYEFQDAMRDEARFGAVRRKDDMVHDRLMKKAKQLGIPLDKKNLHVGRDGGMYVITATYTIPIDLTVYKDNWTYQQKATAPIF